MKAKMVQQQSLDDLGEKIRMLEESAVDRPSLDERIDEKIKEMNDGAAKTDALD